MLTLASLVTLLACESSRSSLASTDSSVALRLRSISDSVWEARFGPDSAPTLFRIRPTVNPFPDSARFNVATWTLYAVPGSNGVPLLAALAKAHHFRGQVDVTSLADSLRLNVAVLAVRATRNAQGAFGPTNSGNWIAAKLFLADGEGEIYLNLNPSAGLAEFAIKDDEYGPIVVRELAPILSR